MLWLYLCICSSPSFFDDLMLPFHAELLELQQRFEEDKKRVARLKAARKFRPF